MEHTSRTAALLQGLTAAFPGIRPLEEADLPAYWELCESNRFYNSVTMDQPPTLESCQEDLTALPPGRSREHKLFLGLWQRERLQAVLDLVEGYPEEGTLYIGLLELDSACHGQGLGTALGPSPGERERPGGIHRPPAGLSGRQHPGPGILEGHGLCPRGRGPLERGQTGKENGTRAVSSSKKPRKRRE